VTCDTPVGRLGLTICYDLRFPHVYQRLTIDGGAQLLLVPSAFTKVTGVTLNSTPCGLRCCLVSTLICSDCCNTLVLQRLTGVPLLDIRNVWTPPRVAKLGRHIVQVGPTGMSC
jgi:hypothetical protein